MTLSATTCLGDNTTPMLAAIVDRLQSSGVDIDFDVELLSNERVQGFRDGKFDLVWACGLLTAEVGESHGSTGIVAAPVFAGEASAVYRSAVIVRSDSDVRSVAETMEGRLAVNEHGSWSGRAGLARWLEAQGVSIDDYATVVMTGSHRNSVMAVADGTADVAAIDNTVLDHLAATEPWTSAVRVLTHTDDWPAPPFSVRQGTLDLAAFHAAMASISGLERIVAADASDYDFMLAWR